MGRDAEGSRAGMVKGAARASADLAQQLFDFAEHVIHLRAAFGRGAQLVLQLLLHEAHGHAHIGAVQGLAHGRHLRGDGQAGLALFDHALDATQLPFGTLEAVEDVGAALVVVQGCHVAVVRLRGRSTSIGHCATPFKMSRSQMSRMCQPQAASLKPSLRKMMAIGQKLVKPNWNRLAPTKAVKASAHFETNRGLPSTPRASEIMMKRPATMRIMRSTVM